MQKILPKNILLAKLKLCLCFIVFFNSIVLMAQTNKDSIFNESIMHSRLIKLKNYSSIDSVFSSFKNDSIKMKTLASRASKNKYPEVECYALISVGNIYRNVSNYETSINILKKAEKIADSINNVELKVVSLNMLGVVYRRIDLIRPALDYHKRALDIASSFKNPSAELKHSVAVSQNSLGNIYLTLEQYDLAISLFTKSLKIEEESNNILGLAINNQNIGYAQEAMGNLDIALKHFELSLDYNTQINSDIGLVICYNSIGKIYTKQNRLKEAEIILEKALQKSLIINDKYYIATSYINFGSNLNELKQYKASENYLLKALEISNQYGLKSFIIESHEALSNLYNNTKQFEKALFHYKSAIDFEKTLTSKINIQYANDIILQYEDEVKNNQIKALAEENELVKLKLNRNQKIFWFTLLGLIILAIILFSVNRTRQLNNEKQILTLEQDMLRSQMNPHFIFNSLNSIKLYIINNEKENAVYYLNKFSKFIRKILIASTEKEMSLEDELETMQLYMNIENIRFSNAIDFKINVEENINTASIKVPSLILQPFLENALWHGLSSKNDEKNIVLNVYKTSDDFVTISITDNGIGRKEAERINKDKVLKRKSVGINITKARLANFSKRYTTDYKITIEDLYNDTKKPIGTKVIVNIPTRSNALKTA